MAAQKFFFINFGFIVGVLISGFFDSYYKVIFWLAFMIFLSSAVFLRNYLYLFSLFFSGVFVAIFYFGMREGIVLNGYPKLTGGDFEVMSVSETITTDKSRRIVAELRGEYRGEVLVFYPSEDIFKYGDVLKVTGDFESAEVKGGSPVIFAERIEYVGNEGSEINKLLFGVKDKFVSVLTKNLSPNAGALASGLLFGEKAKFSSEFKEAMKRSGTTHIVALSGYNISILVGALGLVVAVFSRRIRIFLYFFVIIIFTLMVGGDPSIVRAAIMGGVFLLSKELGRNITPAYALSFAGALMLWWNPLVIYSIGFQLSFLSFMGIVYIAPSLTSIFKLKGGLISKLTVETASAQLAVLPLIVNYFGGFSVVSLISNIFILGTIPISMFFAFLLLVFNFILPFLSFFIVWICEIVLGYQIFIINLFSKLYTPSGSYFRNGIFTAVYVVLLLGIIIFYKDDNPNENK